MTTEETIVNACIGKFGFLENRIRVQRARRIIADVDTAHFEEVFAHLIKDLEFSILCTITGLDEGATLGFIYHMARPDGIVLNLKIAVPKEKPVINTVMQYFPCAEIYERELTDLLGAEIKGLGPGNRYPLPDDWPKDEYPLRKDWKMKAAAKNKGETGKNA